MSIWQDRIRNHQAWSAMESLGPSIDKAAHQEKLTEDAREALERLRTVLSLCGKRLGGSDPLTVVPTTLDNFANLFTAQRQQVDNFIADGNISHLTDANSNADAVLIALSQIPGTNTPQELIELIQLISRYRSELDNASRDWSHSVAKAKEQVSDLESKVGALDQNLQVAVAQVTNQLDAEKQKIANQAIEFHKTFTDSQEARSNTYTETLRKTQETLSNTLSDQQGQFSTAQENRSTQFNSSVSDMQNRFTGLIGDYTKRLADQDAEFKAAQDKFSLEANAHIGQLDTDFRQAADVVLQKVKKHQNEVETLVGVIGSLGVTSGYQKTAKTAQRTMWFWQGAAVASMIAVIVFAWYAFLPTLTGEFHWPSFVGRVFLTITVGVLAAYSAAQADRFFNIERQNRRLALELAAIDPFIALFPAEEQQKFKLEVGRRSFGREDAGGSVPVGKSPATTWDVLSTKEGRETLKEVAEIFSKFSREDRSMGG